MNKLFTAKADNRTAWIPPISDLEPLNYHFLLYSLDLIVVFV